LTKFAAFQLASFCTAALARVTGGLHDGALWNFQPVLESKARMKTLSRSLSLLLTLVLCGYWCFAAPPVHPNAGVIAVRPDAGVIRVGEWSEPVRDGDGHTLRGRLVVGDDRPANNHTRIFLELEHGGNASATEVYYDIESTALNLELRDGNDRDVPRKLVSVRRPSLPPCWITLPCDATVRVRGDLYAVSLGATPKPDGLQVLLGSGTWIIPTDAAGEFYLSGTFTPPADHPSPLKYHVWQGTLKLPKVKIPVSKAVKAG
jgi:hypothetical protein